MARKRKRPRKSRAKRSSDLPKGFYRAPGGGITRDRPPAELAKGGIYLRAVLQDPIDVKKLANILLELAERHGLQRAAGECDKDCSLCRRLDEKQK